jgi:hypothetical protein
LFDNERLLFWIEALGLLNALGSAVAVLPLISQWLKVRIESPGGVRRSANPRTQAKPRHKDVFSTAMDVQRFVQLFGGMILHSTPHLYTSVLPFSPINSTIATRFTLSMGTLLRFGQSRSRPMALASRLVLGIPLYGCGMQRQRSSSKTILRSIPLSFLCLDVAPFTSPQAWNMHSRTLLSYPRPHLMNSIQPGLSCRKMVGWLELIVSCFSGYHPLPENNHCIIRGLFL